MFTKVKISFFSIFLVLIAFVPAYAAPTYAIDPSHSTLGFAVKHLGVSTTRGGFDDYAGSITLDPEDDKTFNAEVTIQATSINTKNESRDNHLRSADFFDTANNPTITFQSTRLEKQGEGAVMVGNLTIKGVTKEITIPVTISGPVTSPMGASVIGIKGSTVINRQDFNVTWNKTLDNGGFVVGNDVELVVEVEAQAK